MGRNTPVYREKRYTCGEYLDVYVYPVYRTQRGRSRKARPTSAVQQKLNRRHSQEKLIRLLHANFTPEDIMETLTYMVAPKDEGQVKKDISNYLRRLKYRRNKEQLPPLKYICVIERSKTGRYHIHLVVSGGLDRDVMEQLWGKGYANSRRLQFSETGITALGQYITKEPVFHKRWNASKNLIDPPPEINDSAVRSRKRAERLAQSERELWEQLHPEYGLAEVTTFHSDETGGVYLFARLYRKEGIFRRPWERSVKNECKRTVRAAPGRV